MKRAIVAISMFLALAFSAVAQGEAEKITVMEGTLLMAQGSQGQTMTMLRTSNGSLVALEMPDGEAARMELRARSKMKVSGVLIGAATGTKTQARILVRTMINKDQTLVVRDPIQLCDQDRLQIRAYEEKQLLTQTQDQTKTQDQTRTQDLTQTPTQTSTQTQARTDTSGQAATRNR